MLQQMQMSMKKVMQKSCFFFDLVMILGVRGPPRGSSEDSAKKTTKVRRSPTILGGYFGALWVPNLILVHFNCANFYAYFWHRFWAISCIRFSGFGGHFRVPFGVILNNFSQMLQNSKNATLSSEMLDLEGVGPPFLHAFC